MYRRQVRQRGTEPAEVPVGDEATGAVGKQALRNRFLLGALAVILILAAATVVIAVRWHQQESFAGQRPSGIPASVPTGPST